MKLENARVLITGGSAGIGLGLAKLFLAAGSRVMITGRSKDKLEEVNQQFPELLTFVSDIGDEDDREKLAQHIRKEMPDINIIINNAGFQRRISLASDDAPWSERQAEINALLSGPIHLNHLLIPLLIGHQKESLIVNVTSGGAYIPQVFAPVYSAAKAALHSYTISLRDALSLTKIRVAELIPPAVQTGLAGAGQNHGANLDEFSNAVFDELFIKDQLEVGFGPTAAIRSLLSGDVIDKLFQQNAARFPVKKYGEE